MKDKPRIFKAESWSVELPAFGFGKPTVKGGFISREEAGTWLARTQNRGSGSTQVERASTPNGRDRWSWGADNWPVIIR